MKSAVATCLQRHFSLALSFSLQPKAKEWVLIRRNLQEAQGSPSEPELVTCLDLSPGGFRVFFPGNHGSVSPKQ